MKRNLILVSLLSTLLISCGGTKLSSTSLSTSSISSSSSTSISSSTSNSSITSSSSSSSTSLTSSSSTSLTSSSSTSSSSISDLGKVSISKARQYCLDYVKDVNSYNIGINLNYKVTIVGQAISRFDLVKTKKAFGLDVSFPSKVVFGDDGGYIAVASKNSSEEQSLFSSVGSHIYESTSTYEITGFLSLYLGKPEIYVPSLTYTWLQSSPIEFDAFEISEALTLENLYLKAIAMPYNCAGHGYDEVYVINDLLCVAKDYKGEAYTFSDGYKLIKVIPLKKNSYVIGNKYSIAGMLTLYSYSPAIREIKSITSFSQIASDYKNAKEISIIDLKKIKTSQEDSSGRFDDYIASFQYMYKTSLFITAWSKNYKYYICGGESYLDSKDYPSEITAHNTYNMIDFENKDCWNIDISEFQYCSLSDYIDENKTVDVYYSLWQSRYLNKKATWKVNIFEDMLPKNE